VKPSVILEISEEALINFSKKNPRFERSLLSFQASVLNQGFLHPLDYIVHVPREIAKKLP